MDQPPSKPCGAGAFVRAAILDVRGLDRVKCAGKSFPICSPLRRMQGIALSCNLFKFVNGTKKPIEGDYLSAWTLAISGRSASTETPSVPPENPSMYAEFTPITSPMVLNTGPPLPP